MKRLLSLLMLCSLALTTQLMDAGCSSCRSCDGSSEPRLTRRQRRAQSRKTTQVQGRAKTKKSKAKAAPAKPAPVKKSKAKAGKIHHISSKADLDALKAQGKPVVVKYSADWCGACTMIAGYFENLAGEFDDMIFAEVNIDKDGGLSGKEGVKALPTIHIHKAKVGKVGELVPANKVGKVGELVGANKDALHQLVKAHSQKAKVVKEIKSRR